VVKHHQGRKLVQVEVCKAHGCWPRIQQGLDALGYNQANTSAVERFNGTARRMNPHQVRRSLAFAHRPQTREALAWWSGCVYNWVRPHRSLRQLLSIPEGKRLYQQRTPAMAIGLADKIWNVVDLLRFPVYLPA
jgi:transposase InsO family protein